MVRPKLRTVSATFSPLPTGPSTLAAGTGMSWKASFAWAVPRIPHLAMRGSTISKPGRSGVTRNAVILDSPPAGSGVRAITVRTSAIAPLVMYRFVPLST